MKKKYRERGQISMGATELDVTIAATSTQPDEKTSKVLRVGDYLLKLREEKQIALKQIATETKINIKILSSLETGDFSKLPSRPYVRGFVVSYCRCIGIDSVEAVSLLEKEYSPTPASSEKVIESTNAISTSAPLVLISNNVEEEKKSEITPKNSKTLKLNSRKDFLEEDNTPEEKVNGFFIHSFDFAVKWKVPLLVFSGLVVFTIVSIKALSLLNSEMKHAKNTANPKPLIAISDIKSKEANLLNSDKLAQIRSDLQVVAPVAVIAPKVEVKIEEKKPEPTITAEERIFPDRDFHKVASNLYQIDSSAPEIKDTNLYPEAIRETAGATHRADVYIVAVDGDLWAHYKVDNKKVGRKGIKQGKTLHLQGEVIRITSGDLRKGKVFYNGSLVKTESPSGIKSMVFPESEQQKFEIPLFVQNKKGELLEGEEYKKKMLEEKAKVSP